LDENGPVVSEEMSFDNVNRRRTPDGRTTDGRWTTDWERSQKLILRMHML